MAKPPPLSRGELEVARAVWSLKEATVGQAFARLRETSRIDYATVQTYLRRLEAKGYLRARREGRNKLYSARLRPERVIRQTVDDLVERLFGGESFPLMQHLIRDGGITSEQLRDLRQLLDELEGRSHDPQR